MKQIASVQILRGLAALMVVFGHAQHDALIQSLKLGTSFERVHLLPWGAGVDLFFIISGFIMVYASEGLFGRPGAPAEFFGRRIARITPLYWGFTALYVVFLVTSFSSDSKPLPGIPDIVASFAFWPTIAAGEDIPLPVLKLGWTLNYEMFFYVLFAAFVGLRRERAVVTVGLILAAVVVLGAMTQPSAAAPFFWTRPIVLEFALGMGIALLLRRGVTVSSGVRGLLLAGGLAILVSDPMRSAYQSIDWTTPNDGWRVLGWGMPAAFIVAAAVLGPQGRPSWLTQAGVALGDASYALYLSHPFVIFGVRKAWLMAGLKETGALWLMVVTVLVVSCVVALAVHWFLERPLTRLIQHLLVARRLPAPAPV